MGSCASQDTKEIDDKKIDDYVQKRLQDPDVKWVKSRQTIWNERDFKCHLRQEFHHSAQYDLGTLGADLNESGFINRRRGYMNRPAQATKTQHRFFLSYSDSSLNSSRRNSEGRVSYSDSSLDSSRSNSERRVSYSSSDSRKSNSSSNGRMK